jgi:hypothetical protein
MNSPKIVILQCFFCKFTEKMFYRINALLLEARQRLKKVLEQKAGPPPPTTISESRLPIPNPNHVKPNNLKPNNNVKPGDVIQLKDAKQCVVKPNDSKPNDVKQTDVKPNGSKPCDVANAGTSSTTLTPGFQSATKSTPGVGQSMRVRTKFLSVLDHSLIFKY